MIGSLNNVDLIRRVSFFSNLTQDQAYLLVNNIQKKEYKRGDPIVQQGKQSHTMSILLRGRARVVMSNTDKREVILALLGPGDYVGEMSLIDGQRHSASVIAETALDVLVLQRADFLQCLETNNSLALAVMQGLVARLRLANRKISSLSFTGVNARVAEVLYEMAQEDGTGQFVIQQKISRTYIAQLIGASREMVSRVMKIFEENGFLQKQADGSVRLIEQNIKLHQP